MKFYSTLLMLLLCLTAMAQNNAMFYGSWVKAKVTYKDGRELTDDNILKYEYLKYDFTAPDKVYLAYKYDYKGSGPFNYSIKGNILQIGANHLLIEKITKDSIILLQEGNYGFDSPDCLRFYFTSESVYQKSIPLRAGDLISVHGTDTIYRASEKIHAGFTDNVGFRELVSNAVRGLQARTPINDHFLATFIINKQGEADSLHIIKGINADYDKQFIKVFNKAKKRWIPAIYNGKIVSIQMKQEVYFTPYEKYFVYQRYLNLGIDAMYNGDYTLALFNFNKALKNYAQGDLYYKIALCQIILGNVNEACNSMLKSEELDYTPATGLIKKYCR
jgi:tetratricopeptide (TPR) repeat protein